MSNDKNYADIAQADFDTRLQSLIEDNASILLSIDGVYDATSEYFHNEIIEDYENENDHFLDYGTVKTMFEESYSARELDILKMKDPIMLREDYNNYTDMLCKDGQISDYAYHNWDNPF